MYKHLLILLFGSIIVVFMACSDKVNNEEVIDSEIVDTWTFEGVKCEVETNNLYNDFYFGRDIEADYYYLYRESVWRYSSDGKLQIEYDGGNFASGRFTYNHNTGKLKIKLNDQVPAYDIEITENKLILYLDETQKYDKLGKNDLKELNINDPNFYLEKAITKLTFTR